MQVLSSRFRGCTRVLHATQPSPVSSGVCDRPCLPSCVVDKTMFPPPLSRLQALFLASQARPGEEHTQNAMTPKTNAKPCHTFPPMTDPTGGTTKRHLRQSSLFRLPRLRLVLGVVEVHKQPHMTRTVRDPGQSQSRPGRALALAGAVVFVVAHIRSQPVPGSRVRAGSPP